MPASLTMLLCPIVAVERSVIYGFADVGCVDIFAAGKVGDGAGNLQYAVVCAGGKALPMHCFFEQGFTLGVESTEFSNLCGRHRGI